MLANLVSLSLVALAVASAVPPSLVRVSASSVVPLSPSKGGDLKVVESRSVDGEKLYPGPLYLLPSGYCNVTLDASELCGEGLRSVGLEVAVTDYDVFPRVSIESMYQVRVERLGVCIGDIKIDVRLRCLRKKKSRSRSRVSLLENLQ